MLIDILRVKHSLEDNLRRMKGIRQFEPDPGEEDIKEIVINSARLHISALYVVYKLGIDWLQGYSSQHQDLEHHQDQNLEQHQEQGRKIEQDQDLNHHGLFNLDVEDIKVDVEVVPDLDINQLPPDVEVVPDLDLVQLPPDASHMNVVEEQKNNSSGDFNILKNLTLSTGSKMLEVLI